jgi:hypothetical protein
MSRIIYPNSMPALDTGDSVSQKYYDGVSQRLHAAADLHEAKEREYGTADYKTFGPKAMALFGKVTLETETDHARFACIVLMLAKMSRYMHNFKKGGHEDSLTDLTIYTQLLLQLDIDLAAQKETEGLAGE